MRTNWLILTGEYPPQAGGVSDYTRQVARELIAAGDSVEIVAPPCDEPRLPGDENILRLPDHFGARGLKVLSRRLSQRDPSRIVLVQYVPHAFGYKAMNLRFCAWLVAQRHERIWTMFHEVAYPFLRGQPLRHHFLASVNHLMATMIARASERAFISTTTWRKLVRPMGRPRLPIEWLPVPSNLAPPTSLTQRNGRPVIAHFGTYGGPTESLLRDALQRILRSDPSVVIWLLGRGGEEFSASLPSRDRITATGALLGEEVTSYLAAADVVLQPYTDGVTTRRSTLMTSLSLGKPVVTTEGYRTEQLWRESESVVLAPADNPTALADQTLMLLHDEPRRAALGARARQLYNHVFDIRHTIAALRRAAGGAR